MSERETGRETKREKGKTNKKWKQGGKEESARTGRSKGCEKKKRKQNVKDRKNTQRKKQGKNKKEKEGSASCAQVVRRDTIRAAAAWDGKLYTHPYHARGDGKPALEREEQQPKGRKFKDKPTSEQTTSGGIV